MKENLLVAEIDAILPQTQCRRCGFPGCRPYAAAIVEGRAEINQCPPGGEKGVRKLAELLGVSPMPLNAAHGISNPEEVALINEQLCIGCTLCIQACPVDAIVGAAKQMHTVIAAECTGCELCVAPCPVDCIHMVQANRQPPVTWDKSLGGLNTGLEYEREKAAADRARSRYQFRSERLEREKQECQERLAQKAEVMALGNGSSAAVNLKKATVQAALERARTAYAQTSKKNNNAEPSTGISFPNS